jgi:hypothetical protein
MSMTGFRYLAHLSKLIAAAKHNDSMINIVGVSIIFFGGYIVKSPVFDKHLNHDFSSVSANNTRIDMRSLTENETPQRTMKDVT